MCTIVQFVKLELSTEIFAWVNGFGVCQSIYCIICYSTSLIQVCGSASDHHSKGKRSFKKQRYLAWNKNQYYIWYGNETQNFVTYWGTHWKNVCSGGNKYIYMHVGEITIPLIACKEGFWHFCKHVTCTNMCMLATCGQKIYIAHRKVGLESTSRSHLVPLLICMTGEAH